MKNMRARVRVDGGILYQVNVSDAYREVSVLREVNGGERAGEFDGPLQSIPLEHFAAIAGAVAEMSKKLAEPNVSIGWSG